MRAFIRQSHRWLSIVFTLTVLANFAAMTRGKPPAWITYSPLPPLFLLLFSGLYLFALPYLGTSRSLKGRAVSGDSKRLSS
jgi:cellulose synthase/poly-beta-1,6-N-acetylglucosamine synthase-like glycosyltransferase